ncbi:MAG: hypothetical protein E5V57_17200 [Mesorhizobium sp.]|nr:MAG: hypothetical protein E5V57_17200 [Mesorhizobium sp.]
MPSLKTKQPEFAGQGDLFRAPNDLPEGFHYQPELITAEEEAVLVRQLESLAFQPFDFHGHLANRRVAGVSLLAPCSFRLRRKNGAGWDRQTIIIEPRSAYLMTGPARTEWQHSIPPLSEHRYSITLRTLHPQRSPRSEATVR